MTIQSGYSLVMTLLAALITSALGRPVFTDTDIHMADPVLGRLSLSFRFHISPPLFQGHRQSSQLLISWFCSAIHGSNHSSGPVLGDAIRRVQWHVVLSSKGHSSGYDPLPHTIREFLLYHS